jgi:hypothetical protein
VNPIFARKVIMVHKNGHRDDYTHVTEFKVYKDAKLGHTINIKGEIDDVDGTRINTVDKFPVKDVSVTIIDWYIPQD